MIASGSYRDFHEIACGDYVAKLTVSSKLLLELELGDVMIVALSWKMEGIDERTGARLMKIVEVEYMSRRD